MNLLGGRADGNVDPWGLKVAQYDLSEWKGVLFCGAGGSQEWEDRVVLDLSP